MGYIHNVKCCNPVKNCPASEKHRKYHKTNHLLLPPLLGNQFSHKHILWTFIFTIFNNNIPANVTMLLLCDTMIPWIYKYIKRAESSSYTGNISLPQPWRLITIAWLLPSRTNTEQPSGHYLIQPLCWTDAECMTPVCVTYSSRSQIHTDHTYTTKRPLITI